MQGDADAMAMRLCLVVSLTLVALPGASFAEGLFGASRSEMFERQTRVLDNRASQQYANSVRLRPDPVKRAPITPSYKGSYSGPFLGEARRAARRHGVPEELFLRLVQQESGWNPKAVSSKGAIGLAQLMPATARSLGVDPRNPSENLDGGARYLAAQYREFRDWQLALAAYNAGPGAVEKYNGIPPFRETQGYVKAIMGR